MWSWLLWLLCLLLLFFENIFKGWCRNIPFNYIRLVPSKLPSKLRARGANSAISSANRWFPDSELSFAMVYFSDITVTNSNNEYFNSTSSIFSINLLSQINGICSSHFNRLKHKELFFKLFLLIYTHSKVGSTSFSSHQRSSNPSTIIQKFEIYRLKTRHLLWYLSIHAPRRKNNVIALENALWSNVSTLDSNCSSSSILFRFKSWAENERQVWLACSYERPPWNGTANERHWLCSHRIQLGGQ